MHSKRITKENQNYQKLMKLKIRLQNERKLNPKPETNQIAPHKRSLKVYLKQSLCSQKIGFHFLFFFFCGLECPTIDVLVLFLLCNAATSQGVSCWACSVPFLRLCWLFTPDYTRHSALVLKWIGKVYDSVFFCGFPIVSYWYVLIIVYYKRL